jgi:hypothetical protein
MCRVVTKLLETALQAGRIQGSKHVQLYKGSAVKHTMVSAASCTEL